MRKLSSVTVCSGLIFATLLGCGATKTVGGSDDLDSAVNPGDDTGTTGFDIGGSDGLNPDGGGVFQDIVLDPTNTTVFIDTNTTPATPGTLTYKATLNNTDGTTKDVSSTVLLTLDDTTLGSFSGPTFTSATTLPGGALGVSTLVHGTAEGKAGLANLTVVALRRTGNHRDFFFVEPYMGAPSPNRDVLKFGTNIKQVDVAFSTDTTGSMTGSINNLKTNVSTTIMPALVKAIPSVGLAVVDFKDVGDTWTVKVRQTVTTTVATAQTAVNAMSAGGGGDEPEADIQSMYHILTGAAVSGTPAHTPAAGTFGGVDFRPGSLPVVVNITDAHWHDPSGSVTTASLTTAFNTNNARFVEVTVNYGTADMENLANSLSDATKSNVPPSAFGGACTAGQCCTGEGGAARAPSAPGGNCRLNFLAKSDGSGVGAGIVSAIQAISVGSTFDVTAVPSNDPTNADGVDATKFIKALRAMDEGEPTEKCPSHAAKDTNGDGIKDTFIAVVVGTPVCFEVLPQMNTTVKPKTTAQFFKAFIDVLGMPGSVKLDKREVLFLVPPKDAGVK